MASARVLTACLTALCLAACVTDPPKPELATGVTTVTVERPGPPVRCVKAEDIPAEPPLQPLPANADHEQRVAWVKVRVEQLEDHVAKQRAVLVKCATPEGAKP